MIYLHSIKVKGNMSGWFSPKYDAAWEYRFIQIADGQKETTIDQMDERQPVQPSKPTMNRVPEQTLSSSIFLLILFLFGFERTHSLKSNCHFKKEISCTERTIMALLGIKEKFPRFLIKIITFTPLTPKV
jgi:hypothetical protein